MVMQWLNKTITWYILWHGEASMKKEEAYGKNFKPLDLFN